MLYKPCTAFLSFHPRGGTGQKHPHGLINSEIAGMWEEDICVPNYVHFGYLPSKYQTNSTLAVAGSQPEQRIL